MRFSAVTILAVVAKTEAYRGMSQISHSLSSGRMGPRGFNDNRLQLTTRLMTGISSSGDGMDTAIAHLRELGESVPIPLSTEQKVDAIALAAGVSFSHDFRRFLLEASNIAYGILEPVNVDNFQEVLADAREIGAPDNLLPICYDNGDYYCVNTPSEAVIFYDHNGPSSECWSDIAAWIEAVWIGEYQEMQDMENDE